MKISARYVNYNRLEHRTSQFPQKTYSGTLSLLNGSIGPIYKLNLCLAIVDNIIVNFYFTRLVTTPIIVGHKKKIASSNPLTLSKATSYPMRVVAGRRSIVSSSYSKFLWEDSSTPTEACQREVTETNSNICN